ncbi:MAG: T9SS type A sorting domain-containing protein [Saprospiraceae bacterium]
MKSKLTLFVILFSIIIIKPLFSQVQLGEDLSGDSDSDEFGTSVAITSDGNRMAIGAVQNDGDIGTGRVRVYDFIAGTWTQVGSDIYGEAVGDRFGCSISLSSNGKRIAIGALLNGGNGNAAGHVRVYELINGAWTQLGIDIDGENPGDFSGTAISLSSDGGRIAIGGSGNDENGNSSGHVRIYEWSDPIWVQLGADIDGKAAGDHLGRSVSLSSDGSILAIGAPESDVNGEFSGSAFVYKWNNGTWTQLGSDIIGENANDALARSLSLSADGTRLAVGAPRNSDNGSNSGHVRVFEYTGTDWVQLGASIKGEAVGDLSGTSVSLSSSGVRVAIGAPDNNNFYLSSGHTRLYEWNQSEWIQVGDDVDGVASFENSGTALALSSDGRRVVIGAPFNNQDGYAKGKARVFEFEAVSTLTPSDDTFVEIYPNPTSGTIQLQGNNWGPIRIVDNYGRIILNQEQEENTINIPNLPAGVYFLIINSKGRLIKKRFFKQ